MRFLLEFVACCGSSPSGTTRPTEDARLLGQEPRRRVPRRPRGGSTHEWRPSLSAISEDVLAAEKVKNVQRPADRWHRSIKRKVASLSQRDRSRSSDYDDYRRSHMPTVMPTIFAPAPFMF